MSAILIILLKYIIDISSFKYIWSSIENYIKLRT